MLLVSTQHLFQAVQTQLSKLDVAHSRKSDQRQAGQNFVSQFLTVVGVATVLHLQLESSPSDQGSDQISFFNAQAVHAQKCLHGFETDAEPRLRTNSFWCLR
jgi:hypothetical protein